MNRLVSYLLSCFIIGAVSDDFCANNLKEPTNRLLSKQCLYEDAREFLNSKQELPSSFGDKSLEDEHKALLSRSCHPKAFYLIGRHSARYPLEIEIEEFNGNITRLRDELKLHAEGSNCPQKYESFLNWVPLMKPEQNMLITEQGAVEERNIAKRYRALYPEFFSTKTADVTYGVTDRLRTAQTAAELIKEVDGLDVKGCDEPLPVHDITSDQFDLKRTYENVCYNTMIKENSPEILMAHKICRKLLGNKKMPKDPKLQVLKQKTGLLKSIGQKIAQKLDLEDSSIFNDQMIDSIFQMCSFESAFRNGSVWCKLLDDEDIRVLEYIVDIKTYLKDAYGMNAPRGQTCGVIQDIVKTFESVVESNNVSGGKDLVKSIFYISHDGLLKRFLGDLGLFKDDEGMSLESIKKFVDNLEIPKSREWRSSLAIPFSSNLAFVLYECQDGSKPEYEVMTLMNERPVKLGECNGKVHCDRDTFLKGYYKPEGFSILFCCGVPLKLVKIDPPPPKRSKRRAGKGHANIPKETPDLTSTNSKQNYHEIIGALVATKFRLIKLLGSGSYGAVYLAKNLVTNELVAVKLEQKATKAPQLPLEYRFIKMIGPVEGFPRIIKIDECANMYHAMVMELLGPSLEEVFNVCERKLGLKSVLYISLQLLTRFQTLHSKNIIYRDVKPENFLLGRPGMEKENIVHIIDYGLAKEYINPDSGTHIAFNSQKGAIGTARYMSVNTHMGKEQSRRDDLEALGYVLIYLTRGSLPWQGLPATDHKERMKKIGDMKKKLPIEEICDRCPDEFVSYLRYVRHLDFYEAPDYDYLKKLFYDLFIQYRFVDDGQYDWTGKFESRVS